MPDDPNKRGAADRGKVAVGQAHEVDYLRRVIRPQVPNKTPAQVEAAIKQAAKVPQFHNDRQMVTNAALGILGKLPGK